MKSFSLIVLTTLIVGSLNQGSYTKVVHNTDPEAKCLDGSPAMVYLHEGTDTKNILLHFLGGAACLGNDLSSTLQQCYQRSKGELGSSTKWPETYRGDGILSTDGNSAFANWTKVILVYCDGSFHQGNNLNAVQYKDAKLYFRGAVNTRSHFKWADNKFDFSSLQKIVVSGSSAGGMAVYMWHQYLKNMVSHPEKVYAVAQSSIFYDPLISATPDQQLQALLHLRNINNLVISDIPNEDPNPVQVLMQLSNTDERPPNKECSELLTEEEMWKCIFVQFSYPTLTSPILFVESSYDQFVIEEAFKFKCLKRGVSGYTPKDCADWQMDAIELYRSFYLEKLLPKLLKYGHSIWSISCVWHSKLATGSIYDSPLQKVPKNDGRTIRNATQAFVFDNKRIEAVDLFAWPANTPCAY